MTYDIMNVRDYAARQRVGDSRSVNLAHGRFLQRVNEIHTSGSCESYYAARQQAKAEFKKKGFDF